ncbi:DUF262 domain-containing protein [Dietzia sp. CW19]|uniref:GmrSD restriction endonuclease domain-containing protein n=1 Tax=unclassified Dietzia TaxID=2617939 RepID=UPI0015FA1D5A|nr:DUF262 domain-containing protein [Dietzia sp. CW19]MBB1056066.1 DUF262 domain-containing protein [Dietzia sp. B19]
MQTASTDQILGMESEDDLPDEDQFETDALKYVGADFDIDGLVRRLDEGDIVIPRFDPDESSGTSLDGFQRGPVWSIPRKEKFIESILLGWPVPSIFMVKDEDERYLVLDGQQRLLTLSEFKSGKRANGRDFVLKDVVDQFEGVSYDSLSNEDKRRFRNTFIQAVIIEPNGEQGKRAVYRLFGRLNSGGVALNAQEVRVAIFRGKLVDWIRELNRKSEWRNLIGNSGGRLKDHELILRSLALLEAVETSIEPPSSVDFLTNSYKPSMSNLLNGYLSKHRHLQGLDIGKLETAFEAATAALSSLYGSDGLRNRGAINAAYVDSILASLMHHDLGSSFPSQADIKRGIDHLRSSEEFQETLIGSTSHRANVKQRLRLAIEAFDRAADG